MKVLVPTYSTSKGVQVKTYTDPEKAKKFWGTFRSFGGTDTTNNDLFTVLATGYIDTWYRSDIKSACRIYICRTGEIFDILGEPEDINMRHQYLRIRVQKIGGKA